MLVDLVFEKSGFSYRVVHTQDDVVYYYPLWESMKIIGEEKAVFLEKMESGQYTVVPDPYLPDIACEPGQKARERCERDYELVNGLWKEHKDEIVDPGLKMKLIKEKAEAMRIGKNTLLRRLDRFLKGSGFTGRVESMLLRLDRCGEPGKPKTYSPGKKKRDPALPPLYMAPIYEKYLKKVKTKGPNGVPLNKTKKSAWEQMRADLFTDSRGVVDVFCPELDQFYKWEASRPGKHNRLKRLVGEAEYYKNERQLNGSATDFASGPNFVWEIDTSTIDAELCDRYNREKPIGCAKMVLIRDVFSRMVMGVYIFLGSDSWIQQVMALVMAVSCKPDETAKYGFFIRPEEWPNEGILPMILRADKGAFTKKECEQLARFGVEVQFTRSGDPTGKGTVERSFRGLRDWVASAIPGCKQYETVPRGEKDPAMQARLTLPELRAVIYAKIVEYNNTEHGKIDLNDEMKSNGVNRSPVEMYQFGMKRHLGQFKRFDPQDLYEHLLPRAQRQIRQVGVRFNNKIYAAASPEDSAYLADHRKENATISYDTNDPGFILLWKDDGKPMEMVVKGIHKSDAGISKGEEEAYDEMDRQNRAESEAKWNRMKKRCRDFVSQIVDSIEGPTDQAARRKETRRKRKNLKESIENEKELGRKVFTPEPALREEQVPEDPMEDLLDRLMD